MKKVKVDREIITKVCDIFSDVLKRICRIDSKKIKFYICKQVIMEYDVENFILKHDYSNVDKHTFKCELFDDMLENIDFDNFKKICSHSPAKNLTYCEALALLALVFADNEDRILDLFK